MNHRHEFHRNDSFSRAKHNQKLVLLRATAAKVTVLLCSVVARAVCTHVRSRKTDIFVKLLWT